MLTVSLGTQNVTVPDLTNYVQTDAEQQLKALGVSVLVTQAVDTSVASGAVIRTDPAGNIKPDKEKSTEKIDGAVATIMALDRAIRCGNENVESVYDTRGLLFI